MLHWTSMVKHEASSQHLLIPLESVMAQQTYNYPSSSKASLPSGWYQTILLA